MRTNDMWVPHLGQFGRTTITLGGLAKTVAIPNFRFDTTEAQDLTVFKFEQSS
jgi:hypothetical protein